MLHDLRYTVRLLRKTPLFTIAVVLTMTLGIGATIAIFSVVNTVMLKPLPFGKPERLVWIAEKNDSLHLPTFSASLLNYLSWKEQARTFDAMGAIGFASFNLSGQGDPEQFNGGTITPSVFPLLGISPIAGRAFVDGEEQPGATPVVMVGEALWKRRFGADPSLIGRTMILNGTSYAVVGIAPSGIGLLTPADIWVPMTVDPGKERRLNHTIIAVGRLKAGVTVANAQADMDAVSRNVGVQFPEVKNWGIHLITFSHWIVGDQLRTSLWLLLGAVACVLLIACGNVANLLLSRAISREREMAMRTALGASRARLLRQLLVESIVLSSLGGALGLAVAEWAVHLVNVALPPGLSPIPNVRVDGSVVAFAAAITIATGLLFGLAPAWSLAKTELTSVLKQAGRSATGGRRLLRNGLAAAELALATMLLVGAGLLGQTLMQLQRVELGFKPDRLLTFQLSPPRSKYPLDSKGIVFYQDLIESLRSIPGVASAAISSGVPFGQGSYTTTPVTTIGKSILPEGTPIPIDWRIVSPDFFSTMSVPFIRGRLFTAADGPTAAPVIIVSQATAQKFWGADDPIGRVIHVVGNSKEYTVVGEVGDVKNAALNQDTPAFYFASTHGVWPLMDVVVGKTNAAPNSVLSAVRDRVKALDPAVPISTVRTMDEWVQNSAAQPKLNAVLLGVFAVVALVVAAVGVYGVFAYSVTQRTREIGVRMALGAPRGRVLRLILREGMTVGIVGIGAGVAGALAIGRVLADLVYGVPVRDPATFVVVSSVLAIVALAACALPAHKASRVDPLVALRSE